MNLKKEQISGLSILLLSKTFERFAFYLILTVLIQFLTEKINLDAENSSIFYSLFFASIGFTSFFSGLLGDLTNRIKIVNIGMLIMTIMYFVLIFIPNSYIFLLVGFILLGISLGLNNTNINVFVGGIFNEKNTQIYGLSGFILLSIVINIGALFAPMIATFIKESYDYNAIFILAFIFALISYLSYLIFAKTYKKLDLLIEQKEKFKTEKKYRNLNWLIFSLIIVVGIFVASILGQRSLTFTYYVVDFADNGIELNKNLLNLEKHLSIVFLILFAIIIISIRKFNWNKLFKIIFLGIIFGIFAYIFASFINVENIIKISQTPIIVVFSLLIISETLINPTINYMVYRSSPLKFKGLFQGVSYTIVSHQLIFLGVILYEKSGSRITFIIFTILLLISGIMTLIFSRIINRKENLLMENLINEEERILL